MDQKTYLEKWIESMIKDEYGVKNVNITLTIESCTGSKKNCTQLMHDAKHTVDYDLIDDCLLR